MARDAIDRVREAYEALNRGDPEPLAALFGPETVWRGVERGFLGWRRAPS